MGEARGTRCHFDAQAHRLSRRHRRISTVQRRACRGPSRPQALTLQLVPRFGAASAPGDRGGGRLRVPNPGGRRPVRVAALLSPRRRAGAPRRPDRCDSGGPRSLHVQIATVPQLAAVGYDPPTHPHPPTHTHTHPHTHTPIPYSLLPHALARSARAPNPLPPGFGRELPVRGVLPVCPRCAA